MQMKSSPFLQHYVCLDNTLSDFPSAVTLMLMHGHWGSVHFRLFLGIRFQNIKPVFSKFFLFLFPFVPPQLEFLVEEKKRCFRSLIRNPISKLSQKRGMFFFFLHNFFFFLQWGKWH